MFEKEAEKIAKDIYIHHFDDDVNYPCVLQAITVGVQKGAEFGYNKAKVEVEDSYREALCNSELNLASVTERLEELEKANEWHYPSKGEYPKDENKICLLYLGNMFNPITGWYKNGCWCFEDDRNDNIWQDEVIAWKEIVLPELKESE